MNQLSKEKTIRFPDRVLENLPGFLQQQRWFGGKARAIASSELVAVNPFTMPTATAYFFLVEVHYCEGAHEAYSIPLIETRERMEIPLLGAATPAPYIEVVNGDGGSRFLYDATFSEPFRVALLAGIRENRRFHTDNGEFQMLATPALSALIPNSEPLAEFTPKLMRAEQSNTSIVYGNRLMLKLFRRVEQGINPDIEIGRFLAQRTTYRNVPLLAGSLEYVIDGETRISMGMLQNFIPNQGDAWQFTLRELDRYFETIRSSGVMNPPTLPKGSLLELKDRPLPEDAEGFIGSYLNSARLLGRRTAELHLALGTTTGDSAFDPESYSAADQDALVERALNLLHRNFGLLRAQESLLPTTMRAEAAYLLDHTQTLERRFQSFASRPLTSLRTRIHGDYHLGQVLVTDDDFVIIDFEGEPARPLSERRNKQSPLQDVAGMLRSFHYAAYAALLGTSAQEVSVPPDSFEPWAYFWQILVSAAFLQSYFETAEAAPFLSRESEEVASILEIHLLEKSIYELGYELNNRPKWVGIPLSGIAQLITDYRRAA